MDHLFDGVTAEGVVPLWRRRHAKITDMKAADA